MNFSTSDALLSYFFIKGILSGVCLLVNFGERAPFPVYWPPAWQDSFFFFFPKTILLYPSVYSTEYAGIMQKWKEVIGINVQLWEYKDLNLRGSEVQGVLS